MKFSLFISLLSASAAWANQSPLSAGSGVCLSPSNNIKAGSYRICYPSTDTTKEETAGGVKFHYICVSWAKPYDSLAHSANGVRECAELCASSSNCAAASWFSSMRKCYLTSSQIYTQYNGTSGALLLEKTRDSPDLPDDEPKGDCKQQIAAAVAECQGEKAALVQTEREECEAAKTTLEQKTRERVENCEPEKTIPPLYFDNDFARPGRWFYQIAYLASLLVKCRENVTRQ